MLSGFSSFNESLSTTSELVKGGRGALSVVEGSSGSDLLEVSASGLKWEEIHEKENFYCVDLSMPCRKP